MITQHTVSKHCAMAIQLVLSVKDAYFFINPTSSWEEFFALIQILLIWHPFHHSSFYFSKESHSRRNICRRNVCRRIVVDEMFRRRVVVIPTYNKLAILTHNHRLFTLVRITCSIFCFLSAMFSSNKTKIQYNTHGPASQGPCLRC